MGKYLVRIVGKIYNFQLNVAFATILMIPILGFPQNVEVKNNSFYINGQKFFVKGIGYEVGATPGKLPWARTFNAEQLRFDIQRILAGGFNTIRTWAPFTSQELDVLKQYNIKIIMGIWIDPGGNFSDKAFVDNAKAIVTNVLSYSKNYDSIIAYLIMNEPSPETIASSGYDKAVALWSALKDIIHAQHPNRPVSIANTCNGTYINSEIFDFKAFNVYIYNPVTVNYLHGYRDYIQYLNQLNNPNSPLIITEFGLSVSPTGPGSWGYGGNSLAEQQNGDLSMYKALVDGGAAGSCIFNYSDGWWKSGDEFTHNDNAEEWFGLVSYNNLNDNFGTVRPTWETIKTFQSAIISQPRSSEIYGLKVPIEIFANDTVNQIEIMVGNEMIYHRQVDNAYLLDTLLFNIQGENDATLVFNCFDISKNLIKSEEKSIHITANDLVLPSIKVNIMNNNYWQSGYVDVSYQIDQSPFFTPSTRLDYIFYPHVGFNYGDKYQSVLSGAQQVNFTSHHSFGTNVNIFTVGAAFDVTYNSFKKRIVNQLMVSRINNLTNSVDTKLRSRVSVRIYPNPVKENFNVTFNNQDINISFSYRIIDSMGILVKSAEKVEWDQPINIGNLIPGIYFIQIIPNGHSVPITEKLVKL